VTRLNWKLVSVHLDIVLNLTEDRCMVCTERTIGSKIILDALDGTLGHDALVKAHFGPFGDSTNLDVR
jgi:hypothetical protein